MLTQRTPESHASRRQWLASVAASGVRLSAGGPSRAGLIPCLHEATTMRTDFKTAIEAYSKAGFQVVELWLAKVDEHLKKSTVGEVRRILRDSGLKPIAAGSAPSNLFFPHQPERAQQIDALKRRLGLCRELGVPLINTPSFVRQGEVKSQDFVAAVDLVHEVGEIARSFGTTIMLEFIRGSLFIGCLSSALDLCRKANHPNVRPMFDTFHYFAGISKLEDLDLLRQGELVHLHINDVPAGIPREALTDGDRMLPGDGILPLQTILSRLKAKGYDSYVSVELFNRQLWEQDPQSVARRVLASLKPLLG